MQCRTNCGCDDVRMNEDQRRRRGFYYNMHMAAVPTQCLAWCLRIYPRAVSTRDDETHYPRPSSPFAVTHPAIYALPTSRAALR